MAPDRLLLADRSDTGRLVLTGEDRVSFLHGLVSNDVARLGTGDGTDALLLTPKGRLLAPLRIYGLPDALLVEVPGEIRADVARRMALYVLRSRVEVRDVTERTGILGLYGPRAPEVLRAGGADLPGEGRLACRETTFAGAEIVACRVDGFGLGGYDLQVVAGEAEAVRAAAREAGAEVLDPEAAEAWRVASGEPRWGSEMDESLLPPEIPSLVPLAVSFTKGCYVGQETMARLRTYGHVNRELCRLAVEGDAVPVPGTALHAGDAEAGTVTSSARHPVTGRPVALGFVRRAHLASDAPLRAGAVFVRIVRSEVMP